MLSALEKSTFVTPYVPFGESKVKHRLSDPFCIFYLKHVKDNCEATTYWQSSFNSSAMLAWSGYAFEDVCRAHIRQIKNALGIGDVTTREMKFSQGRFSVGRDYAEKLQERIRRTMEFTGNSKPVISVLVTTYGLERNDYSGRFQKVLTMEDLFS